MHVNSIGTDTDLTNGGKWIATVTPEIVLVDGTTPVANATVYGVWSNGSIGSCTTDVSGTCDISKTFNKNTLSVSFTITNVTHDTFVYDADANEISEVTLNKP
jgi:hypothetical protein